MPKTMLRGLPLLAILLISSTGCCVHRMGGPYDACSHNSNVGVRPWEMGKCGGCSTCGSRESLGDVASCRWGCGEIYWDEWLSEPPDCCDPCDECGNWAGPQSCCRGGKLAGIWSSLWGCRGEPCSDGECCASRGGWCGHEGGSSCVDGADMNSPFVDEVESPPQPADPAPAPAPNPAEKPNPKAKRPARPYHPSYTRPAVYQR